MYSSPNFTLSIKKLNKKTCLKMQVLLPVVNTRYIPHTYDFLEKNFPDVLVTECFNDLNIPFNQEVRATELGHLFEHILLVNICKGKSLSGHREVVVNGRTEWNWVSEPEGLFHILIDVGKKDFIFFVEALRKTIEIFELLFITSSLKPTYISVS